jgi:hypothetical protein
LDSATAAGVLNIGTSSATTINIGSTVGTTAIKGPLTVPVAYGIDTAAAGQLNIGTTTAHAIRIGSSGITTTFPGNAALATASSTGLVQLENASSTRANFGEGTTVNNLIFGTCTVTVGNVAASSTAISTCSATGVTSNHRVFVTPALTEANMIFKSASSSVNDIIQVAVYNNGHITGATDPADNVWSWMAIK